MSCRSAESSVSKMIFLVLLLLVFPAECNPYVSESFIMYSSDRPIQSRCVQIPSNLTLCSRMQYTAMRLPNLLEHETLDEVIEQAQPWLSLLNINCHPDTQMFLCSLFAPVCMANDQEIKPCRSLCEAVKEGCEKRMTAHGFPWPEILSCDRFPKDNDMCMKVQAGKRGNNRTCPACSQVGTYENILDHYCHSQYVMKGKIRHMHATHVKLRKVRSLKPHRNRTSGPQRSLRSLRREEVVFFSKDKRCPCPVKLTKPDDRVLIMANITANDSLVANLFLPWNKDDKSFKRAIRKFEKLNCKNLGRSIRQRAIKNSIMRRNNGSWAPTFKNRDGKYVNRYI